MSRLTLLTVTAILLLAGCTSSGDDADGDEPARPTASSPGATPVPEGPECADVWKAGETLPADYTQCVTDGVLGSQETTDCQDGTTLVAYDDTLFAITGERIREPELSPMQDTEEFAAAYSACTGE